MDNNCFYYLVINIFVDNKSILKMKKLECIGKTAYQQMVCSLKNTDRILKNIKEIDIKKYKGKLPYPQKIGFKWVYYIIKGKPVKVNLKNL